MTSSQQILALGPLTDSKTTLFLNLPFDPAISTSTHYPTKEVLVKNEFSHPILFKVQSSAPLGYCSVLPNYCFLEEYEEIAIKVKFKIDKRVVDTYRGWQLKMLFVVERDLLPSTSEPSQTEVMQRLDLARGREKKIYITPFFFIEDNNNDILEVKDISYEDSEKTYEEEKQEMRPSVEEMVIEAASKLDEQEAINRKLKKKIELYKEEIELLKDKIELLKDKTEQGCQLEQNHQVEGGKLVVTMLISVFFFLLGLLLQSCFHVLDCFIQF